MLLQVFGSGKKGGKIWISVSKNPNNNKPANYNVSVCNRLLRILILTLIS